MLCECFLNGTHHDCTTQAISIAVYGPPRFLQTSLPEGQIARRIGAFLKNNSDVKILYVEDNPADAEMTLRALKNQKLLKNVVWVKNGEEAIDYLFREGLFEGRPEGHPNLVLLDLKMPKVDGLEVLRRIRASPVLKFISVVSYQLAR
jgi:CheY-like chemotaxis protein